MEIKCQVKLHLVQCTTCRCMTYLPRKDPIADSCTCPSRKPMSSSGTDEESLNSERENKYRKKLGSWYPHFLIDSYLELTFSCPSKGFETGWYPLMVWYSSHLDVLPMYGRGVTIHRTTDCQSMTHQSWWTSHWQSSKVEFSLLAWPVLSGFIPYGLPAQHLCQTD